MRFLDIPVDIQDVDHPKPFLSGDIEFKQVSYTYPETQIKAIQDLSFYVSGQNRGDSGQNRLREIHY